MTVTTKRKSIVLWTMLLIAAVAGLSTSMAITVLYRAALDSQQERLVDTVQSLSRLVESVARFDRVNTPDAPRNATLGQLIESQGDTRGFGRTGEFLIGERNGDRIVYLLPPRFSDAHRESDWNGSRAEVMRRALSGEKGTTISVDYRGEPIMAAFDRVEALDVGLVAKIDLAEVREPFVRAGLGAGAVALLLILAGSAIYWRVLSPVFDRIQHRLEQNVEERTAALQRADDKLRLADMVYRNTVDGVFVTDINGTILSVNPAFTQITGYSSEEAVGQNPRILKSMHQGPKFYRDMWQRLKETGHFEGEMWNRRKNGEAYLQQFTVTSVTDDEGQPVNFVSVFTDITELREKEEHIQHQLFHDALTDLPNRTLFVDRLQQALEQAARTGQRVAVLLLDLDRFKVINDTLGHHKGDLLLQLVADRLSEVLRKGDTVSRFGGDEFAVLINGVHDTATVEQVANNLVLGFDAPFVIEGQDLTVTTSIGVAVSPDDGRETHVLLKNADTAMYRAKDAGRNNYRFYTADMNAKALDHLHMENGLRGALERGEFELYYQPRLELESRRVIGMEALLRWNHPEKGMVSPGQFIPIAEESGLIVPIGAWVLREASRQAMQWHEAGYPLRVSVNLSARQFSRADLLATLDLALAESGLPPDSLELELTETVVMQHADATVATLNAFKERGVRLAVDDFGTGYSSLSYLKRFPIDVLKIDQSFVRDITTDPEDAAIAEAIIGLGHSLGLEVLAEGIETDSQLEFLRLRACDSGQGYLFSRPLPVPAFTAFLHKSREERLPDTEYA